MGYHMIEFESDSHVPLQEIRNRDFGGFYHIGVIWEYKANLCANRIKSLLNDQFGLVMYNVPS